MLLRLPCRALPFVRRMSNSFPLASSWIQNQKARHRKSYRFVAGTGLFHFFSLDGPFDDACRIMIYVSPFTLRLTS
jgi:hypothetical protein